MTDPTEAKAKSVLIVLAHEEPKSFCSSLRNIARSTLSQRGYHVLESDLYKMDFDAIHFEPALQAEERHKLHSSDLVLLVFPFWWGSVPAIMKGWIEMVFEQRKDARFEKGLYAGKKAQLVTSVGGPEDWYRSEGLMRQTFDDRMKHLTVGVLKYNGFHALPTLHYHMTEDVAKHVAHFQEYCQTLDV